MNLLGEDISDLRIIDEIFAKFEKISGAILSRTKKSKDWPLPWLRVVPMIKMFGFRITPVYKQTLELSQVLIRQL